MVAGRFSLRPQGFRGMPNAVRDNAEPRRITPIHGKTWAKCTEAPHGSPAHCHAEMRTTRSAIALSTTRRANTAREWPTITISCSPLSLLTVLKSGGSFQSGSILAASFRIQWIFPSGPRSKRSPLTRCPKCLPFILIQMHSRSCTGASGCTPNRGFLQR